MSDHGETSGHGDFDLVTAPFRGELLAYCYRMLGSVHDAEDLVQETYLRAWRSFGQFQGRSSVRTWLYRIATNACLTARESLDRRPLPSGLHGPVEDPHRPTAPARSDIAWLQPAPDRLFGSAPEEPGAIVASRHGTRLALIAALQYLPARQAVVLILRDVLQWRASEVAELLDTSTVAVNSALQRARIQIEQAAPAEDEISDLSDRRELLDRYVTAVENADTRTLIGLMAEDVVWEMPPVPSWLSGRETVSRFLTSQCPGYPGDTLLVPTSANGQPAFGAYARGEDGVYRSASLNVLTLSGSAIARIVSFGDPGLFPVFGLPLTHPGGADAEGASVSGEGATEVAGGVAASSASAMTPV